MLRRIHHLRKKGFTFVELMLGIIVTSIVLCALAVFIFGVGENWQDSDSAQSAFLAGSMGVDRLNQLIRCAQRIDANPTIGSLDNSTPAAACMLWTDNNSDGNIQYDEMALLQYDPTKQRLLEYAIPAAASNAMTQTASLMTAASFRALPNITKTPVANDVSGCQLFSIGPSSATPRPSVEIILKLQTSSHSSSTLIYTTATLRAPG